MKTIIHKASDRGAKQISWLKSYHSFSFGDYQDPNKMSFGLLRVLNDDYVEPGMGFGMHGHENMEIVSIPLYGSLNHQDSMGNDAVIKTGDVQIMSAGTGIRHAEFNGSKSEAVKFLQIWVFPKQYNIAPRYAQKSFKEADKHNQFLTVVSPDQENEQAVWINQDAWFSLANLDAGKELEYKLNGKHTGVYVFVLQGQLGVAEQVLDNRDAIGVYDTTSVSLKAHLDTKLLVIEVPMA
jgi:redox-sensitive bicupin YhaK (pirin superfamily)